LHLVTLLRGAHKLPPELRLLDLCTGTGCIPLLFQHELHAARDDIQVQALGVDVADEALELARHNAQKLGNNRPGEDGGQLELLQADVLLDPFADLCRGPLPLKVALNRHGYSPFWDILISNPPYISPTGYWKTTTRSVRGFEPKLALVPPPAARRSDTQQGSSNRAPCTCSRHLRRHGDMERRSVCPFGCFHGRRWCSPCGSGQPSLDPVLAWPRFLLAGQDCRTRRCSPSIP
jgi:hypothetical protein